jgi:hypothetical protein
MREFQHEKWWDEIHAKLQEGYDDVKGGSVQDATIAFAKDQPLPDKHRD